VTEPRILRVTGALVEAEPLDGAALYELVWVGERRLVGEIIRLAGPRATLQVYEDTAGLKVGEPVQASGEPLAVQLGPGLLGSVLDGVGRRLVQMAEATGDFIVPGASGSIIDLAARWNFEPWVKPGERISGGDILGTVEERPGFEHRVLVPPGVSGVVTEVESGARDVAEPVVRLEGGKSLSLSHRWPVREPRPSLGKLPTSAPFLTGQRIFDFLFPVAEGGTVAVPGGFGTGKTIVEQSLAKYGDADVVVFVGCGERGNEMAEVLREFPTISDPRTGRSLMDRTVLVVNTSNMPVAAREASIYLGITIAEYYRDMGYRVAMMADSLSRWAEALREISARLQEMPGEEGYPSYLGNRLAKFYERAGCVRAIGRPERTGSITMINALSPPGGDFSEPVTQASLRVAGALWALDSALAHQRQFPAVDWETSYSLYLQPTARWFEERVSRDWTELRDQTVRLLQRERELREITALVGREALHDEDRLVMEVGQLIREFVLAQSAYDPNDAWSPVEKTYRLASAVWEVYRAARASLARGVPFERLNLDRARRALSDLRRSAACDLDRRFREAVEAAGGAAS
jgi:V/A-type H+-transporting ATPase subunit A